MTKRMTTSQLSRLRRQLEAEREQLLAQVAVLDESAVVGNWTDSGFDDDTADLGGAVLERERAQSLSRNASRILGQVEEALRRIDDGTYGTCERCAGPIEPERLAALPYATLCIADKRLDERTS